MNIGNYFVVYLENIISWLESQTGHSLNNDEGFLFGKRTVPLKSVLICWAPTSAAIETAAANGCELIIHHEVLTMAPPPFAHTSHLDQKHMSWDFNSQRINLLNTNNLSCLRIHGSLDEICIYEAFRKLLGLDPEFTQQKNNPYRKLYRLKQPTKISELIEQLKDIFSLPYLRHTFMDPSRVVRTLAIPWGGMCLSLNVQYLQGLIDLGEIDVMIAGETDNYGARFCKEIGIDIIEVGHEVSEDPGIYQFRNIIAADFKDVSFYYYPTEPVFQIS